MTTVCASPRKVIEYKLKDDIIRNRTFVTL